jgi:chromosome segregation protein
VEKEFGETKTKYDFLDEQTGDLESAIGTLEGVIKELDGKIKERFDKEFKEISHKFEEYFKILFNGGSAKIIKLEDEESVAAAEGTVVEKKDEQNELQEKIKRLSKYNATGLAGIEIQACPPGKKISSINMLSGGEKALTAIALICAIISANPSPFVFLDEVDAALDESNSERLAKILEDLSSKTQFIVITHNRAPMHRASVLYGVTMQENGVSKLLSIKLEDYIKN